MSYNIGSLLLKNYLFNGHINGTKIFTRYLNVRGKRTRHPNLGNITEYLVKEGVPQLLQRNVKSEYIDENIKLRITTVAKSPYLKNYKVQGKMKYEGSMAVLRMLVKSFILDRNCHFHITSVHTKLKGELSEDEVKRKNEYDTLNDKLLISWQSCLPDEIVCKYEKTSPIVDEGETRLKGEEVSKDESNSANSQNSTRRGKFISGKFIFEFNDDNTKIIVQTIENIEMISYKKLKKVLTMC